MKQLEILKQHKNKVIIIAVAIAVVLSLVLTFLLRDDAQAPADRNIRTEQSSQSAPDTATGPSAAGSEKSQPDEDAEASQDASEDLENPSQATSNNVASRKPAPITAGQPQGNTGSDDPIETQPEQQPQATLPDADASTLLLDSEIPSGSQPSQPVVQQRRIVLSKGPCLVQSTYAHPYDGWPFLHFERMGITVSQSSNGRTLATLLSDSHTGDWGTGSITVSASQYCNDNIRHRHLYAATGATVPATEDPVAPENRCQYIVPAHWGNVPFQIATLAESTVINEDGSKFISVSGWCYRDIPRSSWG